MSLALAFGCSSPQKVSKTEKNRTGNTYTEESEGRAVTNSAALEAKADSFVEIQFAQGSAALSESSKASLKALMEQSSYSGKLDEIIVLSWADEEYPSKNLRKLPKAQRDLAEKRNQSVAEYLKSMKNMDIDTYNMAKQPNTLSKWFNTTDTRLKRSLVAAGLPTTADNPQYPSKASHSVILVKLE